jgi:ADP-ribose pyrophosphatase YjhB (NUDIX family)
VSVPLVEVSARMLLHRPDQVLLAQDRGSDSFHLPGGLVARGERVEAAVRRTVAAQTGITPGALDFVGCVESTRREHGLSVYAMDVVFAASAPYSNVFGSLDPSFHLLVVDVRDLLSVPFEPARLGPALYDWLDNRRPFLFGRQSAGSAAEPA